MAHTMLRFDTEAVAAAATAMDDIARELIGARAAASRVMQSVGGATTAVTTLADVEAMLTERADDLRTRVQIGFLDGRGRGESIGHGLRDLRDRLAHLGAARDPLLARLPDGDRRDDPIDAMVRMARQGSLNVQQLIEALQRRMADLLQRDDAFEVLGELARGVLVPDAPSSAGVGPIATLVEVIEGFAEDEVLAPTSATVMTMAIVSIVADAIDDADDPERLAEVLGQLDTNDWTLLLPVLDQVSSAGLVRLLTAMAAGHEVGLGDDRLYPHLDAAIAGLLGDEDDLGPAEVAAFLSELARIDPSAHFDRGALAELLLHLAPLLRPGGAIRSIAGPDGLLLDVDDVRRLVVLTGNQAGELIHDAMGLALIEIVALLTPDGAGPGMPLVDAFSDEVRHRLGSLGEWLGTLTDALSDHETDVAADRARMAELVLMVPGAKAVSKVGEVAYDILSAFLVARAGVSDVGRDRAVLDALEHALQVAANHSVPGAAVDAIVAGFARAAFDT